MRPSPMRDEYQRPTRLIPASNRASTATRIASAVTSCALPWEMPLSMICLKTRGWATVSNETRTSVIRKAMTRRLYGRA